MLTAMLLIRPIANIGKNVTSSLAPAKYAYAAAAMVGNATKIGIKAKDLFTILVVGFLLLSMFLRRMLFAKSPISQ